MAQIIGGFVIAGWAIWQIAYRLGRLRGASEVGAAIYRGYARQLPKEISSLECAFKEAETAERMLRWTLKPNNGDAVEREMAAEKLGAVIHFASFEDGRHFQAHVGIFPPAR